MDRMDIVDCMDMGGQDQRVGHAVHIQGVHLVHNVQTVHAFHVHRLSIDSRLPDTVTSFESPEVAA